MVKRFGLKEAGVLAGEPEAHFPTVKATLRVLGVANVVAKEVARLVAEAKTAIAQGNTMAASLRIRDTDDEQSTVKAIDGLRRERNSRATANTAAAVNYGRAVSIKQTEIDRMEELAKKFA